RTNGDASCADCGSEALRAYAKARCKELGLTGQGKVRINSAGCLDRCDDGPVMVIYPEAVWYTFVDEQDVDEIINQHLIKDEVVERLKL
ncbi:unnamed protein product, partial [Cyprideis torosa]